MTNNPLFDALDDILENDIVFCEDQTNSIILEEPENPDLPQGMKIKIGECHTGTVLVKLDKLEHPGGVIDDIVEGARERCDYAVIVEQSDYIRVIVIELKASRRNEKKGANQVLSGIPLVHYLYAAAMIEQHKRIKKHLVICGLVIIKRNENNAPNRRVRQSKNVISKFREHRGHKIGVCVGESEIDFPQLWNELNQTGSL